MHDLVSAMARYFYPQLSFIGQGMHIFLLCLLGLPGYRTNRSNQAQSSLK